MQQGYLRHIGFGPMRAAWCFALRCAALLLSIIGFGFSHSSIFHSGPEPLRLPILPLSPLVPLLCSALLVVDALGSSLQSSLSHGCPLARANLPRPVLPSLELDSDATATHHEARLHPSPLRYSTIVFVLPVPAKLPNGPFYLSTPSLSSSPSTRGC